MQEQKMLYSTKTPFFRFSFLPPEKALKSNAVLFHVQNSDR